MVSDTVNIFYSFIYLSETVLHRENYNAAAVLSRAISSRNSYNKKWECNLADIVMFSIN